MSEAGAAAAAPAAAGAADRVTVAGPAAQGMVTLRADLAAPEVAAALAAAGFPLPGRRAIVPAGEGRAAAWMSPDELLLLCPAGEGAALAAALSAALAGVHHLAADVTDARVRFDLCGPVALQRETLAKLTPTDLAPGRFEPGELRRTRLAQVPAAFWLDEQGFAILCFRSVAAYVAELLANAARPGGALGLWHRG
jgi:sarcosine oxidase subunit gamma